MGFWDSFSYKHFSYKKRCNYFELFLVIIFTCVNPSYFLANFHSCCLRTIYHIFWGSYLSYFFDNQKYNIITFRYIIHKPNESKSKFGKTYRVSWDKLKEHPFKISTLELCPGVTMSLRDADSKLLCCSG